VAHANVAGGIYEGIYRGLDVGSLAISGGKEARFRQPPGGGLAEPKRVAADPLPLSLAMPLDADSG
jgi:hypothetical protein